MRSWIDRVHPDRRAVVIVIVSLVAAACGGTDDGGSQQAAPSPRAQASPSGAVGDAPTEPTDLTVQATEYAFTVPEQIPAGPVTITLQNVGGTVHEASLARIPAGKVAAVEAGNAPEVVSNATFFGGPARVGPGETSNVTGAVLEPGTYAFLCFFPQPDGTGHVELGMMETFEVTGETDRGLDPPGGADATFVLDDYTIEVPDGFDGSGSFTVRNEDDIEHEIQIYAVPAGIREEDVAAFLEDRCRTTDCTQRGGLSGLRFNKSATVDLDLSAGTYVLACFVGGPGGDGEPSILEPPHWKGEGMWELVEIT